MWRSTTTGGQWLSRPPPRPITWLYLPCHITWWLVSIKTYNRMICFNYMILLLIMHRREKRWTRRCFLNGLKTRSSYLLIRKLSPQSSQKTLSLKVQPSIQLIRRMVTCLKWLTNTKTQFLLTLKNSAQTISSTRIAPLRRAPLSKTSPQTLTWPKWWTIETRNSPLNPDKRQ